MNQQNLHFSQGGEGSICNNVDMVGPGPKSKGRPNPDNLNLQRKSNKKIATWNVRTMHQCRKTLQVITEMKSCKLDISRNSGDEMGRKWQINKWTSTIFYSGNQNSHSRGVGILVHDITDKALIFWKPVNNRIITAPLHTRHAKVTVIQAYAPTNVSTDDEKSEFYNHPQETLDEIPHLLIKLLIGDFNAQIDSNSRIPTRFREYDYW